MRKSPLHLLACLCLCLASLAQAQPASADPADPVQPQPQKVLVTHNGASVLARATVPVQKDGKSAFFTLLLPDDERQHRTTRQLPPSHRHTESDETGRSFRTIRYR